MSVFVLNDLSLQYSRLQEEITEKDIVGNLHVVLEVRGKTEKKSKDCSNNRERKGKLSMSGYNRGVKTERARPDNTRKAVEVQRRCE